MGTRVKSAGGSRRANSSSGSRPSSTSAASGGRKVVGQYMLGKTIGEGTFGKVKLAVHIPTGEKVAVKILEKSRIREQADVRRVNREIKILKKTRHPNIIQLYEVLDTESTIYLIMEHADGGEMFDYIVSLHRVPERDACILFHQLIDGVEALHANSITHRDLKPENLLLKPAEGGGFVIKIVDFGLSNTHEGGRLLQTACGSPCYAAPEMIAGKEYVGPIADMWSIGVILFALVCGYLPFEDQNTSVLYRKILSGTYNPPQWISPEVKDLIRKILETDPKKRISVSDLRQHPWYRQVVQADIPVDRDHMSSPDDASVHNDALTAISNSGLDVQVVLDGIASHACNSTTAMYHLLHKKIVRKRFQSRKVSGEPQQQMQPQPSISSEKPASPRPPSQHGTAVRQQGVGQVVVDGQKKPVMAPVLAPIANTPVPTVGTPNPLLVVNTGIANTENKPVGISPFSQQFNMQQPVLPPNSTRQQVVNQAYKSPITPYHQPPQLLQQVHHHGTGSGDYLVPGEGRAHSAGSTRSGGFRGLRVMKQPLHQPTAAGQNVPSPYVPRLNLPGVQGSTPVQQARNDFINDLSDRVANTHISDNTALTSQTARDPQTIPLKADIGKQPLSARAPLAPASSSSSSRPRPAGLAQPQSQPQQQSQPGNTSGTSIKPTAPAPRPSVPDNQVSVEPNSSEEKSLPSENQVGNFGAEVGVPVAVPALLADLLGINPDEVCERPSTRRSHMRSRGGGDSREGEGRPQSGIGDDGMDLFPRGSVSPSVGVHVPLHMESSEAGGRAAVGGGGATGVHDGGIASVGAVTQTAAAPTAGNWPSSRQVDRPPIVRPLSSAAAPEAPSSRPSQSSGGRRGKNISGGQGGL